ncbi:MAG: ECF transporter S component [Oscillospiraceae bacterium]
MNTKTKNLVIAGLLTALGIAIPQLFHLVGMSGSVFLPMHIPVLLCGIICGPTLGGLCGLLVPLLCGLLTGMPPLFPVATYMACELIAYGVIIGFMFKKTNVFVSLITAMLGGRVVLGIAQAICMGIVSKPFGIPAFLTGAFVTALPGIVIQLVLIPAIILLLKKTKVLQGA